jgi:hypothetical protein
MTKMESDKDQIRKRVACASRAEVEELKGRAVAVLERVCCSSKHRLRSKVEDIEAAVAIETIAQIEAAERGGGSWFVAKRRLQLNMKYFR